jgi:preprotein translocase subunit SecA
VEARNFDIRKHLLDYDDVMNKQRQAFYTRRRDGMTRESVHEEILDMTEGAVVALMGLHWPEKGEPDADVLGEFSATLVAQFGVPFDLQTPPFLVDGRPPRDRDVFGRAIFDRLITFLEEKKKSGDALAEQHAELGYPRFEQLERDFLLQILDSQWKDHLHTMDGLRDGIGLRGYASRDPKLEYQREGYALFEEMNERIDGQALEITYKVQLRDPDEDLSARKGPLLPGGAPAMRRPAPPAARPAGAARAGKQAKVGRNDPCPCGSGRKYKKCCGAA